MSRSVLETLVRDLYAEEYRTLGPSPFRYLDTILRGYQNPVKGLSAVLKQRAEFFRRRLRRGAALFPLARLFAPIHAAEHAELQRHIADTIGNSGRPAVLGYALVPFLLWSRLRYRYGWFEQPHFCRRDYP